MAPFSLSSDAEVFAVAPTVPPLVTGFDEALAPPAVGTSASELRAPPSTEGAELTACVEFPELVPPLDQALAEPVPFPPTLVPALADVVRLRVEAVPVPPVAFEPPDGFPLVLVLPPLDAFPLEVDPPLPFARLELASPPIAVEPPVLVVPPLPVLPPLPSAQFDGPEPVSIVPSMQVFEPELVVSVTVTVAWVEERLLTSMLTPPAGSVNVSPATMPSIVLVVDGFISSKTLRAHQEVCGFMSSDACTMI